MKRVVLYFLLLFLGFFSGAQNLIVSDDSNYVGTSNNALFEVYSSNGNKGILIPRLTTSQRTSISTTSVDEGLVVYDTDTKSFWVWDGNQWTELGDKQQLSISGHYLSIENGNTITLPDNDNQTLLFNSSTNMLSISGGNQVDLSSLAGGGSGTAWDLNGNSGTSSSNFIGTTDQQYLQVKTNNTLRMLVDDNNNRLGIGSDFSLGDPQDNIEIRESFGSMRISAFNNYDWGYPKFYLQKSRGTTSSPSAAEAGDILGVIGFMGGNNSNVSGVEGAEISAIAETNWSSAKRGSLIFSTNNNSGITERARITSSGNVGIGTSSPSYRLDVAGDIRIQNDNNSQFILGRQDNSDEGGQMYFIGAGSYGNWTVDLYQYDYRIWSYVSHDNSVLIFNNNSSYETNLRLVDGTGYAAGGWQTSSDKRIKSNVKDLPYGLSAIMKLQPVEYDKKVVKELKNGQFKYGRTLHSIGFIAQDVYKVIPAVVHKPKDEQNELWGIDYSKFSPVLVKAIQEQEQKIESQQETIEMLKKQNEKQQQEIEKLKRIVEQLLNK